MTNLVNTSSKRKRLMTTILLISLTMAITLPIVADWAGSDPSIEYNNPIANYWRLVREGVEGYTAVSGQETNVLIIGSGEIWRQIRNGPLATYSAWLGAITAFALTCFFLVRGKVRLTDPPTGDKIHRWTLTERVLHWITALLFIVLAVTGLSLLYGRAILMPLIGHVEFAAYAEIAKLVHNYLGPVFIIGLLWMLLLWFKDNLPNRYDVDWFKAFGGMVGNKHPSAERMNAGEKAWFWLLAFGGLAVCFSGLVLDFPNFGQTRIVMQIAHISHVILGVVLVVGSLGHIYIGTIGTEGAFEGMITGQVDASWAKQHHDLWYQEIIQQAGKKEITSTQDTK